MVSYPLISKLCVVSSFRTLFYIFKTLSLYFHTSLKIPMNEITSIFYEDMIIDK